ncbi:MAG: hypothetical protein DI587_10875 [Variovorax paradoxus]|nr:MAG: hypothetical protein DI583_10875 [Variovorax paradoxus]PZQ10956.1 MAG: hypothetical protein DI587_10875 [Variovorax paradoxus]
MPMDADEINRFRNSTKALVDGFPDLDAMLANGRLEFKRGWYAARDAAAQDALAPYVNAVRVGRDKTHWVKISKPSAALRKLAAKF